MTRAKLVVAVLLILVIAGLLVLIPFGGKVGGPDLSGLSSLISFGPKNYFQMQLVADKESFAGKTFEISNTSLQISGLCAGYVQVFGASFLKDTRCGITADGVRGKLEYSIIGTIDANIEADQIYLDGLFAIPTNNKKVAFSIMPTDFFLSNYNSNSVSLEAVVGEIKKFKPDGRQDQVKILSNEPVVVSGYMGDVRQVANTIVLNGFATKVNWFS